MSSTVKWSILFDRQLPPGWLEYTVTAVLFALLLLAVYGVVLTHCYGLNDDYIYLWVIRYGPRQLFDLISAMGRPLYQWLTEQVFSRADTLCSLASVRALTLASTVALALQLHRLLRRRGWALLEAACLSWMVCTTPAVGLFVGWAITFPFVVAMTLGLASGELAWAGSGRTGQRRLLDLVVAAMLLYTALSIYQHAAMAYWLVLALVVLTPTGMYIVPWRRLGIVTGVFGLTLLLYFIIFKWRLAHFMAVDPQVMQIAASRTHLVGDWSAKLTFLGRSLLLAASFGQFVIVPWLAMGVLGLIMLGWLVARRRLRQWRSALIIVGLPLLAYLPSVVVSEDELKIRLFCVLSALLIVYLAWALLQILATPARAIGPLLGLALWSGLAVHHNVARHIVALHVAERKTVSRALQQDYTATATRIAIVRPAALDPLTGGSPLIEYGTPTAAPYPDFARVMVQLLFGELFHSRRPPRIVQCAAPARTDCPALQAHPQLPVIDLRQLTAPS